MAEAPGGFAIEFFAELGRCDADEQFGTLGEVFAAEVHCTVLGDDVVGLEAGSNNACTGGEYRLDFVESLVGGGCHSQEGEATFGTGGSVDEVVLAPHTGEDAFADGVGANLSGEVYFEAGVNRYYLWILRDDERVVGPCYIAENHIAVVVHQVVEATGAQGE